MIWHISRVLDMCTEKMLQQPDNSEANNKRPSQFHQKMQQNTNTQQVLTQRMDHRSQCQLASVVRTLLLSQYLPCRKHFIYLK